MRPTCSCSTSRPRPAHGRRRQARRPPRRARRARPLGDRDRARPRRRRRGRLGDRHGPRRRATTAAASSSRARRTTCSRPRLAHRPPPRRALAALQDEEPELAAPGSPGTHSRVSMDPSMPLSLPDRYETLGPRRAGSRLPRAGSLMSRPSRSSTSCSTWRCASPGPSSSPALTEPHPRLHRPLRASRRIRTRPWEEQTLRRSICARARLSRRRDHPDPGRPGRRDHRRTVDTVHTNVGLVRFTTTDGRFRCSGTLISPKVVLTAGHCTEGPATDVYVSFDIELRPIRSPPASRPRRRPRARRTTSRAPPTRTRAGTASSVREAARPGRRRPRRAPATTKWPASRPRRCRRSATSTEPGRAEERDVHARRLRRRHRREEGADRHPGAPLDDLVPEERPGEVVDVPDQRRTTRRPAADRASAIPAAPSFPAPTCSATPRT